MTNPVGAAPYTTPRRPVGHSILVGVAFLAALVASCAVLGRYLPFPEVPLVRDKIEYLARHGDEFDVLFLGSSRIHSHLMPAIFDQVAGENGVPVKSFNAGVAGLRSPEDGYVLEEILRRPHRRLRWIFIELSRLGTGLAREETARFGYWHDNARLVLVTRRLYGQALERQARLASDPAATFSARYAIWSETAGIFFGHLRHWLARAIHLGRGSEALADWLGAPGQPYVPGKSLGEKHDGWMSMDRDHRPMPPGVRAKYEQTYADRLAAPAGKERGDPVSQSALERLLAAVSESGITPLLIVPPTTSDQNFFPTAAREQELTILDFSDVRQNAGLFAVQYRVDLDHLNDAGAELFSRVLAQRFVELVKSRGPTP